LLSTLPEAGVVSTTDNLEAALKFLVEHCPSLALLIFDTFDQEHLTRIEAMRAACPQMKMLALVQRTEEVSPLEAGGVDAVLMQGVKTSRLTETILALLNSAHKPAA
jgi:DNA-binding NarL/FixJ family response regulator